MILSLGFQPVAMSACKEWLVGTDPSYKLLSILFRLYVINKPASLTCQTSMAMPYKYSANDRKGRRFNRQ